MQYQITMTEFEGNLIIIIIIIIIILIMCVIFPIGP